MDGAEPRIWDWQNIAGGASLAARAAGAGARMLRDRADDARGRALPRSREQLATPAVLDALLRDARPRGAATLPPITQASLPGVEFESSNCRNFRIDVEFAAATDSAGAPVPRSLYAKLPCEDRATRIFANAVGFWATECAFCERVATQVAIRVPRVYAVSERGARFVLLMENLHDDPSTELFINRDMAAGTTVERAERCLTTFAELHAPFWGWDERSRRALLPDELHTFLAPKRRRVTRAMNAAAIDPAHRAAPEVFEERHARLCRLAIEKWDRLLGTWYANPLTLIHGDSHLGNCFEYDQGGQRKVGMIDFQGMHWCGGLRDVQYFLINSLEPKLAEANEARLIEHYCETLGAHDIDVSIADATEQYRAFVFQTLMVAVVPLGMGALTERESTLMTVLQRSIAAVDRWDLRGFLERL